MVGRDVMGARPGLSGSQRGGRVPELRELPMIQWRGTLEAPMRSLLTSSSLLIFSTGAWTVVMALHPAPRPTVAVVGIAVSLWTATVAAIAGMVVSRSRWARRTALAVTAAQAILAVIWPVDGWWAAAAVAGVGTALAVGGPWLNGIVRSRPAASGPPTRVILIPLLLISVPFLLGVAGSGRAWALIAWLSALLAAFWFIRVLPGALIVVRLGWPVLALALAWPLGWPAGAVLAASGLALPALSWHSSVTTAVRPLVRQGSIVPVPPELAPRDVLDAANLDERGRPR